MAAAHAHHIAVEDDFAAQLLPVALGQGSGGVQQAIAHDPGEGVRHCRAEHAQRRLACMFRTIDVSATRCYGNTGPRPEVAASQEPLPQQHALCRTIPITQAGEVGELVVAIRCDDWHRVRLVRATPCHTTRRAGSYRAVREAEVRTSALLLNLCRAGSQEPKRNWIQHCDCEKRQQAAPGNQECHCGRSQHYGEH